MTTDPTNAACASLAFPRVSVDPDGVSMHLGDREAWRLLWNDLDELIMWVEANCYEGRTRIGLRSKQMEAGRYLGVHEAMVGWYDLLAEIDVRLGNVFSSWDEGSFPPMAPKWGVLWGRPTSTAERAVVSWADAA